MQSRETDNPALHEFASYEEFFPFYVAQHSKPATRWFHFVGTHLGGAIGLTAIARRKPKTLAAAPVVAYALAWFSHFAIEGNKPASFGHPFWSIRGDFQMLGMMWQGRNAELTRIATDHKGLTVHDGDVAA